MTDLSGQTIKGYELHNMIGAGGFGAVYRAYQPLIKRDVAMKIILPDYANHPDFIRRFEFEAQLVARLEHIHIVPLYDYWREPDGAYLIMRWLRGGSLRDHLREGPVGVEQTVQIVNQVCAALHAAHRRGVIHRDLKPDNVLFDEDGNAYLADFGIAKDLRRSSQAEAGEDIDEGALTGSPFYLSPEQARTEDVSPPTDIYSMGIVIYEMLTGQPPFVSDQGLVAILLHHINDPVPPVHEARPDLPRTVDMVIQRATAKDPAARYQTAIELAADFNRALGADGASGTATGESVTPEDREQSAVMDDILIVTKPISATTLIIGPDADLVNPYKGLQAFQEADAGDFHGRDDLIERLLERMQDPGDISRFLAVIGPSGSGKSSVVKAGIIPALRRGALPGSEHWYLAEMVPGADPFQELATALLSVAAHPPDDLHDQLRADENGLVNVVADILPDDDSELLLVIDQFEEVFTVLESEETRAHFLNNLLLAIARPDSRIRLIITLRADFYDRPLLYPGFGEMVRRRNEVVLPLSADEMRDAIVKPAENAGLTVEGSLVTAMVAEISEQPGALPLMQYALTELFERRDGNVLTLEAYRASGGVLGALARRAEELYQAADPAAQAAMRQMFLRMVTLGDGSDDTRRRVSQVELMSLIDDDSTVSNLLDTLGRYRLLTFDHDPQTRVPTIEVAHEALIREWQRLRGWLDESREDLLIQRRIAAAAAEWQVRDREPSFLATGMRLDQFADLAARDTVALTPDERAYVDASIAERDRRAAEEAARAAREAALERRAQQRNKIIAWGGSIAAAILAVLAIIAFMSRAEAIDQRREANDQRDIADEQRQIAEDQEATAVYNAQVAQRERTVANSLRLVANAQKELINYNVGLARVLALKAVEIDDPPEEAKLILAEAAFAPGLRRIYAGHEGPVFGVALSPDGTTAVSGGLDMTLRVWDVATGEMQQTLTGHEDWIRAMAFHPDGQHVLSGARDGALWLWDLESGAVVRQFEGHADQVRTVAFNADGSRALSGSADQSVILWDVATGEVLQRMEGHEDWVRAVTFGPDGDRAYSGGYDFQIIGWDLATGEAIMRMPDTENNLPGHNDEVTSLAVSSDGTRLLSGSGDQTVRLWDLESGEEIMRLTGHGNWVKSVAFNPDETLILSGSDDGTVRVWDAISGDERLRFTAHEEFVEQVVFTPDGWQVLSASGDGTVRLWDLTNGAELHRFTGHTNGILDVALSPDGTTAYSTGLDTTIRQWDVATQSLLNTFEMHTYEVGFVVISPDGTRALSSDDAPVLYWDTATGEIVHVLEGHEHFLVYSAAFSPDGTQAITGSFDNQLIVWDLEAGTTLQKIPDLESVVLSTAYSPDGTQAITGAEDGTIIVWDTATWEPIQELSDAHEGAVNSLAFNSDGSQALSASSDTTIALWNTTDWSVIRRYEKHNGGVRSAVFSPDDTRIASGSDDGTVRIWDTASGEQIRRHTNGLAVINVAYAPDGSAVISGSADNTVRLWDATPLTVDDIIDWMYRNRVVPDLSCAQRVEYDVDPKCDAEGNPPTSTPYPGLDD